MELMRINFGHIFLISLTMGVLISPTLGINADIKTLPLDSKDVATLTPKKEESRYANEQDIDAALAYSKKHLPSIHEDALRVWKNFTGKSDPNSDPSHTYRSWARNLVIWLRKDRHLTFESQDRVAVVFKILKDKNLISPKAAILLTQDVWSYLIYREGVPDIEKHLPSNKKNQKEEMI